MFISSTNTASVRKKEKKKAREEGRQNYGNNKKD